MKKEMNVISELSNEELKEIFGGEWVKTKKFENGVVITYWVYR